MEPAPAPLENDLLQGSELPFLVEEEKRLKAAPVSGSPPALSCDPTLGSAPVLEYPSAFERSLEQLIEGRVELKLSHFQETGAEAEPRRTFRN